MLRINSQQHIINANSKSQAGHYWKLWIGRLADAFVGLMGEEVLCR